MNVTNVVVICLGGSARIILLGTLSCRGGWRSCKRQSHLRRNTAWPVMGHKGKAMDQLERCSSLLPRISQAQRV